MGLYAVVRNRRFAEASVAASENHFGVRLREGTRAYRFNWIFSRSMAIGVGTLMMIGGFLGRMFFGEQYQVGWIMSVIGAMLLLFLYRLATGRRGGGV